MACRAGLVSDTNKVLECLDDYEIRRIVASCAVVRQHVRRPIVAWSRAPYWNGGLTAGQLGSRHAPHLRSMSCSRPPSLSLQSPSCSRRRRPCSTSPSLPTRGTAKLWNMTVGPVRDAHTFRHTVQRIHATLPARVNELLDPDLKAELTQAANFIRTSTTLFISSYKAHLTDTKEVGAPPCLRRPHSSANATRNSLSAGSPWADNCRRGPRAFGQDAGGQRERRGTHRHDCEQAKDHRRAAARPHRARHPRWQRGGRRPSSCHPSKVKRREFILLTWLKPIRVLRATT